MVYRGGLLGGLGHNHVVSHQDFTGSVTLDSGTELEQFAININVADFVVDDPAHRAAEGDDFSGEMSDKSIKGTTKNMLGRKLLDAENFPALTVQSTSSSGNYPDLEFDVIVTVLGKEHPLTVPATVVLTEDSFVATGQISTSHRDIGLKPFKAGLGTVRVRNEMVLRFEIHGDRYLKTIIGRSESP